MLLKNLSFYFKTTSNYKTKPKPGGRLLKLIPPPPARTSSPKHHLVPKPLSEIVAQPSSLKYLN